MTNVLALVVVAATLTIGLTILLNVRGTIPGAGLTAGVDSTKEREEFEQELVSMDGYLSGR